MASNDSRDSSSTNHKSSFALPNVDSLDLKKISPTARLSEPDYIPTVSARGRDIFQRLFFNTGALFLLGFGSGGVYGSIEGFRTAVNPSLRIRVNSVINGMSKRGSKLGNALGIIAFLHTSFIGIADLVDVDGLTGYPAAPILAGLATGALFGSPRGYRAAGVASVLGAGGSYVIWFGGSYVYNIYLRRDVRY